MDAPGADWALAAVALLAAVAVILAWVSLRRGAERAPVREIEAGQARLAGALSQMADAQAAGQMRLAEALDARLGTVERRMGASLSGSAEATARSLGRLGARLEAIERTHARIESLSGDVLGLRALLDNKQARGVMGEIQLTEIVSRALPPDAWRAQATLSNGRRADCLILLPHPPGPIAVDAKFPLDAYEALTRAEAAGAREAAGRARKALRAALTGHLRDIAQRYVIPGETADCALMFLPSEAVFAECHARFAEVVRAGMEARVWIVSPTTLMAVLNTLRGVMRDARLAGEGARIRREVAALAADVERIGAAAARLERHVAAAGAELGHLTRASERAGARAARIDDADFGPRAAE